MPLGFFCLFNLFLSPILKLRSLFLPSPPRARAPQSGGVPWSASRQARGAGPPVGFLGSRVLLTRACPAQPSKANPGAAPGRLPVHAPSVLLRGSRPTRAVAKADSGPLSWRSPRVEKPLQGREPWHRAPGGYAPPEKCPHPAVSVTGPVRAQGSICEPRPRPCGVPPMAPRRNVGRVRCRSDPRLTRASAAAAPPSRRRPRVAAFAGWPGRPVEAILAPLSRKTVG